MRLILWCCCVGVYLMGVYVKGGWSLPACNGEFLTSGADMARALVGLMLPHDRLCPSWVVLGNAKCII